jgi:hypothetical protein
MIYMDGPCMSISWHANKRNSSVFWRIVGDSHGRDRMVVGFATTYAISAYHHWCCEFESW